MSRPPLIRKAPGVACVSPHLADYAQALRDFSWQQVQDQLGVRPGETFNMAWAALARWRDPPHARRVAFRCLRASGGVDELSYAELATRAARFASVLRTLGVAKGERVFLLLGRTPELYVAALGTLWRGSVLSPLFAAFGPEPLATRLKLGEARVLVTTESLYRRKLAAMRTELPRLEHILIVADDAGAAVPVGTRNLAALMEQADASAPLEATSADDPALLHFTSGTTGRPKGAVHVHGAAVMHYMTGEYALDLHPEDVFWCTADPGWVTGTSYGILAPLLHGVTSIVDEQDFDAERWYRILEEQRVSVWYTAPTAIRMLMKAGPGAAQRYRRDALRFVASVGEPLNAEAVWWGVETLGLPIHDNWWQTETGGIMIGNTVAQDVKPGSMGRPLPGVVAAIVRREGEGAVRVVVEPGVEGELALRRGWPSMFRGYLHEDERYRKCFVGDWYLTGDLATRDADGYYWFVGRADDVIKSSGHLIGPFEVESVLMEHPAVAEAGVIGKPDPIAGELVKAFVSLKAGFAPGEQLRAQLLAHARRRLGAAVAPKEIEFTAVLPRTRSGKIMRRLLKARELGLPEGDTSMLEADSGTAGAAEVVPAATPIPTPAPPPPPPPEHSP